jgi:hypothetical protein
MRRSRQFEQKDKNPTPQELIKTSGKNRGWIYKAIRKLSEEVYISFLEGKAFKPGRLFMAPLGNFIP